MSTRTHLRETICTLHRGDEQALLTRLQSEFPVTAGMRKNFCARATQLVDAIRSDAAPGLMEVFLAEYGLSTEEGIALMCLAEALLRVPDAVTMDALIEDKIAPSHWDSHLGQSSSSLVNASTWALMLTGRVLRDDQRGIAATLKGAIKRVGEPVIRLAVQRAMRELGQQFVLGETIEKAIKRGQNQQDRGYTYSYDMLGEAALTAADAAAYFNAYADTITAIAPLCRSADIRNNPGISVKLSALHPRYEVAQRDRVMAELVPKVSALAAMAAAAGMGFNIDAEEANRLDLSLDVIEAVLKNDALTGWAGFGVVVQAYGKRASAVIRWLDQLATDLDRHLMVRLVKGAYWDTEIKRAQVDGVADFPVFTRKAATDMSYILCAKQLLHHADRLYPQFATHNAHTVAAILEMAEDRDAFEFQRLHGMGEALHGIVLEAESTRCRIYAPVGTHKDLLAYLVRRLLENGANSSFVNQIVDTSVPSEIVAADPFLLEANPGAAIQKPSEIFAPSRPNSRGWDLTHRGDLTDIETARAPFRAELWTAGPLLAGPTTPLPATPVCNPANGNLVGQLSMASDHDVQTALGSAQIWTAGAEHRRSVLFKAAEIYETHFGELFALLCREAGKTQLDAVSELREAVDFLRYYGAEALRLPDHRSACGIFTCISPWNFPLAIFTGQIAAALAAGNGVLAKPAETTSLVAYRAVQLMHMSGVPKDVLQLLPGEGATIGGALTGTDKVNGVCFTGSTETAQQINRTMARHMAPGAPLIAETGGLNAMIVDATALPEQAVKDVIASAFQSAGQRCSALRMLYVQEDIADLFLKMLFGAMDELRLGDPWALSCDVGPVIDAPAKAGICAHIETARANGQVLKELTVPDAGTFVGPTVIQLAGVHQLTHEVFGPVLHVATFRADQIDAVINAVNATGYGLTFGLHSRINRRVEQVIASVNAGNIYINRNQIGAIVGSQPFGGEGLSGTGPKAGGPSYVERFTKGPAPRIFQAQDIPPLNPADIANRLKAAALDQKHLLTSETLPGPTGESNRLSTHGRGVILCLGPSADAAQDQANIAQAQGCTPVCAPIGTDANLGAVVQMLAGLEGFDAVVLWADTPGLRAVRCALADRDAPLLPLLTDKDFAAQCRTERHVCIDTTAAGGNAALLAEVS